MRIEDNIAIFSINIVGSDCHQSFIGTFKVKTYLSPLEIIKADKLYRELLGKDFVLAAVNAKDYSFALSQLQYRIVDAPPFWLNKEVGGGHVDKNVILDVLEKAIEAQNLYIQQQKEESERIEKTLTEGIKKGIIEKEEDVKKE